MSVTRTLEPAVKLLFAIVKQDPAIDAKNSEQMLIEAKSLIQSIRRLTDFIKLEYEGLSKTLNKEIKFENDVNLDTRDENGATFLTWASYNGHTPLVGLLLEHKANPDKANEKTGATPLSLAVQCGHTEIVRLLLEYKANPDKPNEKTGATPLGLAAQYGHTEIVRLLMEHKANPDKASEKTGATPLGLAVQGGHTESVRLLLEHKANPDRADEKMVATPLAIAAHNGHTESIRLLLKHKSNPSKADAKTGSMPLGLAAQDGYTEIVRLLLEHKVNPDQANEKTGATPLGLAAMGGHTESVRLLLEHKANPDKTNEKTGATPLVCAAFGNHIEIVRMLLNAGANVDVPTKDAKTALDYAIEKQNLEMIVLLLKHSAVIKSPEVLFNFLLTCDPRDPDILFTLNKLKEQQNRMRNLKVTDAKIAGLRDDKYKEMEIYHTQLFKVSERFRVKSELLNKAVGNNTFPNALLDIICKLDAPLYRLNNSDTFFRNKKQADEFREQIAKKYKEFFPSHSGWNPFK